MKNLIVSVFASLLFVVSGTSQTTSLKMSGGLWAGFNQSTSFIGFMGPKFTTTFPVSKDMKLEFGVNGIPGLLLGKESRAVLCLGSTITLHTKWKVKPNAGFVLLKNPDWQFLWGMGISF